MGKDQVAILALWETGTNSKRAIARDLKLPRSTVQRVIKRHEAANAPGPSKGRPRSARTPATVQKVRQKVSRNPERSIRRLSQEHKISPTSMHRLVRVDLKLKSLKKTKTPKQTERSTQRRLQRTQILLNSIGQHGVDNVVYSDEKKFTITQNFNRQNDRVLAPSKKEVPAGHGEVETQKFPASVMVWAAASADWKSQLIIFPDDKVNSERYQQYVLNGPVLHAAQGHFRHRNWIFTQDGATCHTAQPSRNWFRDHNVTLLANWPPNSPDLNPFDFHIWDALSRVACSKPHNSVASLKDAIQAAWAAIPQADLAKACRDVPKRCQKVIAAAGGRIE